VSEGPNDLRDLVGANVPEEELTSIRRAHELMLAAGPLPELPPSLHDPPAVDDARDASAAFALLPRRGGRILTLAAAFALLTLVIGYVVGNHRGGFETDYSVAMKGTQAAPRAEGVIRVGHRDSVGNSPLELQVVGLKRLPQHAYYVLYLTRHRKPAVSCGTFRVHGGATTVRMNAPYRFRSYDGWVVVEHERGQRKSAPVLAKYFT
jgi:hypothetical protein